MLYHLQATNRQGKWQEKIPTEDRTFFRFLVFLFFHKRRYRHLGPIPHTLTMPLPCYWRFAIPKFEHFDLEFSASTT